jgi:hypothetical protein
MPSPSIVPSHDHDVYLLLDDYGSAGRARAETDVERIVSKPSSPIYCMGSTADRSG